MNTSINVDEIMAEIREEAKKIQFEEPVSFNDIQVQTSTELFYNYYQPIEGNIIKRFVKRIIRKMVGFLIKPLIIEINNHFQKNEKENARLLAEIEQQKLDLQRCIDTLNDIQECIDNNKKEKCNEA